MNIEYKIVTENDWSGVYFRCNPNEDCLVQMPVHEFSPFSKPRANRTQNRQSNCQNLLTKILGFFS